MKAHLFLLSLLFSINIYAQQNDFIFHSIEGKNGLSYSSVRDIIQDNNGYIWIATLKGLNRYDGYTIKRIYKSKNGLSSNCIEKLLLLNRNNLLLGTSEGLCLYNLQTEAFSVIPSIYNSDLYVHDMIQNRENVYISSGSGLYLYNKRSGRLVRIFNKFILQTTFDINGNIWGVSPTMIYCFQHNGHIIKQYTRTQISPHYPIEFSAIYKDSQGAIWVGTTEDGLYHFNKSQNVFHPVTFSSQDRKALRYIRCIKEDLRGNLWIGTENGLFIYDYKENRYTHYLQNRAFPLTGLTDNALYSIYRSREDIMWIGTYFGGVNYTSLVDNKFHYILSNNGENSLKGKAVSNIIKDRSGSLWIASEDNGVTVIHPDHRIEYINKTSPLKLNGNNVHSLAEDYLGNIWVGNFVDGLERIEYKNHRIKSFKNSTGKKNGLSNNSVYKLFICNADSMLIGTNEGIDVYYFKTGEFSRFLPNRINTRIDDILLDTHHTLWFSAHFGGVYSYNMYTRKLRLYKKGLRGGEKMVSDNIYCSYMDSSKRLWFGTSNGGLMFYNRGYDRMVICGQDKELNQRDVFSIKEDSYGYLWMSTDNGIFCFNPHNGHFTHYQVNHNLISNQFNANAGYKDDNGTIYFGSINGVCYFQPEELIHNSTSQNVRLTFSDFKINNKDIYPDESQILQNSIDDTDNIELKYNMNTLSFDFLVINYDNDNQLQYTCEYIMKGAEKDWNVTQQMPQSVTYANLPSGKYVFCVRVVNKNGQIIAQREISIHIHPYFFASTFMIFIYLIIGLYIAYIIIHLYKMQMKDKMDIKIERLEKDNLQELNKHRLNFFTYVTHEFKTPLSILAAIFENLSSGKLNNDEVGMVNRNIQRLQFLINQLLDFRSIETDHEHIEYIKADIMAYGESIFNLFTPIFKQRKVYYQYITNPNSFYTVFDQDKIEKIISNLLSNAFKHSNVGNKIIFTIEVDQENKQLILSCFNSSSYIHPEQREAVLQPFTKTDSADKKYSHTGIGLALVNGLVQLLSGSINIQSSQEKGTTFIIQLPLVEDTKNMIIPNKKPSITNSQDVVADTVYLFNNTKQEDNTDNPNMENKRCVLLVEDNVDINKVLKSKLSLYYKVKTAYDGEEAIKIMKNHIIDIVISDIMMPKMDGYELSRFIKDSREFSHIPIILITAQSSKFNEMQSLTTGADAYIEKPFSFDELNVRIINLLRAKSNILEYYQDMKIFELKEKLNNKDENFIKMLTQYIIDNVQNPNLSTELASHHHISRTQLYCKLKKLFDLSTTEFINKIKIDIAKQKITEGSLSIAEISWQLGFGNPSYFSKTFKRFAGMTPNEYKNGQPKP